MTSWRTNRRDRWRAGVGGEEPSPPDGGRVVDAGTAEHVPPDRSERMHEALVCVRLTSATPGSRLLDFLRSEPCAVAAWWIAADVDAMVRMASTSWTALNRAVADLRRRGGAEVVDVHVVLRALDLSAPTPPEPLATRRVMTRTRPAAVAETATVGGSPA
ncbi:hypothetical protein [Micromonospora haikouensis]|uniref:hypothetical protein n=1 Tax=Micromonospora haikouensis TaxID=686309 RepID=UPI003D74E295